MLVKQFKSKELALVVVAENVTPLGLFNVIRAGVYLPSLINHAIVADLFGE